MQSCGPDSISAEDKQEIGEIIMKWVRCVPAPAWEGFNPNLKRKEVNVVGAEEFCENLQGFEHYEVIKKFFDKSMPN